MIKIAICDDNKLIFDKIEKYIYKASIKATFNYEIFKTTDSLTFLSEVENTYYDIIILDIEMPGINGFEIAEKAPEYSELIFISNYSELVFDSFKFHPYNFIRKEYLETLTDTIVELYNNMKKQSITINTVTNGMVNIKIDEIVYMNTIKNYVHIYCKNNEYKSRITIKNLVNMLDDNKNLVMINSGEFVNVKAIEKIHEKNLTIKYKEKNLVFDISRSKYAGVVNAFLREDKQ